MRKKTEENWLRAEKTAIEKLLYTAGQAAEICGFEDPTYLQVILDRGQVTATAIRQGGRTRRMFTREQLIALRAMRRMLGVGIPPAIARAYIHRVMEWICNPLLEDRISHFAFEGVDGVARPITHPSGSVWLLHSRDDADYAASIIKAIEAGAYVLDYQQIRVEVDRGISSLPGSVERRALPVEELA